LVGSSSSGIGALGIAALGVEFAVHDPRQSGLPGPVRAARCDAFRSADGQADALAEQVAFAQAFAEERCPSRRHRGLGSSRLIFRSSRSDRSAWSSLAVRNVTTVVPIGQY